MATITTLTRNEISDKLSKENGVPKQQASNILDTALNEMIESLAKEGELKLSAFGSFSVRQKRDRVGRNPKTGVEVTITPRKAISFKASSNLKGKVCTLKKAS
ncbi:MAG: integration host factor subunit alpha [Alphaproteobacteria bacterium]|nr:integration host factor subunit alpha [Alphaproteobacteria bacterium]